MDWTNCRRVWVCLSLAVLSIASAQSTVQRARPQKSDAQKSFELLKTFAGRWKGEGPEGPVRVLLRVTSGGSALLQEMTPDGRADDPTNGDDDPITMIYVDGDRLILVMYCDSFKNRPRMVGTLSSDGKTVDFDFLDVSGGGAQGYMDHATFTMVDADHHVEDWGVLMPAGKHVRAHMNLVRM
jgi:hypothetical protein